MASEWNITLEGAHKKGLWLKTLAVLGLAILVLASFQSAALVTWSYDLPISPFATFVSQTAETWHSTMEKLGVAGLSEAITDIIASLHDDWPVSE